MPARHGVSRKLSLDFPEGASGPRTSVREFGRVLFDEDNPIPSPVQHLHHRADAHPNALATRRASIIGVVVAAPDSEDEVVVDVPLESRHSGLLLMPPSHHHLHDGVAITPRRGGRGAVVARSERHHYSKRGRASLELLENARAKHYSYNHRHGSGGSNDRDRPTLDPGDDWTDAPISVVSSEGSGGLATRRGTDDYASQRIQTSRSHSVSVIDTTDSSGATTANISATVSNARTIRQQQEEIDWAEDFVRVPPKRKEWWSFGRAKSSSNVSNQQPSSGRTSISQVEPRFGEWRGSNASKRSGGSRNRRRSLGRAPRTSKPRGPPLMSSGGLRSRMASFSAETPESTEEGGTPFGSQVDTTPARYGQCWSLDLFSLYHNVVRYQLGQMIAILRRISSAPCGPAQFLQDLFSWLDTFQKLVNAVLAAHERVIFPWIESVAELEQRVSKEAREEAQAQMEEASVAVSRCRDILEHEGDDQFAFATLVDCLTLLGGQLVGYFKLIERECPPALEMFFTPEAKNDVESTMRDVIMRSKGQAEVFFPMVSIWLEAHSHSLHQKWLNRVMRGGRRRLQLMIWTKALKAGYLRTGDNLIGKRRPIR